MKVELQCGDTIAIPEGFTAIIRDKDISIEKEFEDGDILVDDYKDKYYSHKIIMIYKGTRSKDGGYNCYIYRCRNNTLTINEDCCSSPEAHIRYATKEEKQELFERMQQECLQWNAEEKRVEGKNWRAKYNEKYYFFDSNLKAIRLHELWNQIDNERYTALNYFHTESQTEEAAKRVKETLRKYHEEIGE